MIATIPSATLLGADGRPVTVEVHIGSGLPGFTVVGLPDSAVRESRDRVRAALLSAGRTWPNRKVTVNLVPSGVRKGGSGLDLPIAIGVLVAGDELPPAAVARMAFLGELGLDGSLRSVPGVLAMASVIAAPGLIVPQEARIEAALVDQHEVRGARTMGEVVGALLGEIPWPDPPEPRPPDPALDEPDLCEVRGQRIGRWAVEIAAAGGHHMLMTGPPGAGKTLLARRLPGLLPPLTRPEALETTRIHSAAGVSLPPGGLIERAPLRQPHHTASSVSLIGGGSAVMRPGEISLAANGVLFLDELAEFPAAVLDTLRQPLEEGVIRVSRARGTVTYPARFLLVAAMNPCPCGMGAVPGACRCNDAQLRRYLGRVSGPLLDRFDLRVPVARADVDELMGGPPGESSAAVAARVAAVRALAAERGVRNNASIPLSRVNELAPLEAGAHRVLLWRLRQGALSARGMHRVRRVARTIADLDGQPGIIEEAHVCAALDLRADRGALGFAS